MVVYSFVLVQSKVVTPWDGLAQSVRARAQTVIRSETATMRGTTVVGQWGIIGAWEREVSLCVRGFVSMKDIEPMESTQVYTYRQEEITGYQGLYNRYIKRFLDLVLAVVLLVLLMPIYLLVALLIIGDTGFPVLYRAHRGGYKGRIFTIYKFRTMVEDADKIGGGTTALNDNRITKVGEFLRKTKLDETAQLINIIRGDMSFVGPRPELVKYTSQYSGVEECILEVRPGITDYSSIEFINLDEIVGGDNADEMYEKYVLAKKNQLRVKYAATVSLRTDVSLFVRTVFRVVEKAARYIFCKDSGS